MTAHENQPTDYDKLAEVLNIDYTDIAKTAIQDVGVTAQEPHRFTVNSHAEVATRAAQLVIAKAIDYAIGKATEGVLESAAAYENTELSDKEREMI